MKIQTENKIQNKPPDGRLTPAPSALSGRAQAAENSSRLTETAGNKVADTSATSPDIARLQTENEHLKTKIRIGEAHRQITGELTKAGARSPELLFDSVKSDLQFADDGTAQNVAALVEQLKRDFPEQFGYERPPSIDAGAGRAAVPHLSKAALAKMKPAEIAQLDWAEVRRVLAG